ncbi:membrane protein [Lysobacter xinjiangensis]|uniref:Membrane protein n=1 Tax=Cognatilysobacter xinjiangensis TaxID=546892 RepID=A0ABQ3BMR7_9GAMM|nr:TPM domain-containing protein [Lysobacter xinjiangensis]GGZ52023.1 membrane protein [Lysobacter xinjiangensis]
MRALRHLFAPSSARLFPEPLLRRVAAAIAASEARHAGEICFAVEAALPLRLALVDHRPRERALEVFARLRVWDTEANNGVLVYMLLADHAIEIVADRGFNGRVDTEAWAAICRDLEQAMRAGDTEAGVLRAVDAISALLERHFPRREGYVDTNELPDRPHML